jgi:hypothetical protein
VASAQRELSELVFLLRSPEHDSNNIGVYLAAHADVLGPVLRTAPEVLRRASTLTDERVVPELRRRVASVLGDDKVERAGAVSERSTRGARLLGQTVRWTELGGVLDIDLLLHDVIADRQNKYVAFVRGEQPRVVVRRDTLARSTPLRRNVLDLVAFVDELGLHFRWKAGRGGLNLLSQVVPPADKSRVLEVTLRPESDLRPSSVRLGDLLHDMGLRA